MNGRDFDPVTLASLCSLPSPLLNTLKINMDSD